MRRLSALYKWISSCRVFRLMQKRRWTGSQWCLINRCAYNLIGTFDIMKLGGQTRPVASSPEQLASRRGFPKAKKHLITQTVDIFGFLNQLQEAHRYPGLHSALLHSTHSFDYYRLFQPFFVHFSTLDSPNIYSMN